MSMKEKQWAALVPSLEVNSVVSLPAKCTMNTKLRWPSDLMQRHLLWKRWVKQHHTLSVTLWLLQLTETDSSATKLETISREDCKHGALGLTLLMVIGLLQIKLFSTNSKHYTPLVNKLNIILLGEVIQILKHGMGLVMMMGLNLQHALLNNLMITVFIVKLHIVG